MRGENSSRREWEERTAAGESGRRENSSGRDLEKQQEKRSVVQDWRLIGSKICIISLHMLQDIA